VVNAGVSHLITGADFEDAFINSVVGDYAALGATSIGHLWSSEGTNPNAFLQTASHALLGGVAAELRGGDFAAGALGGAVESILDNVVSSAGLKINKNDRFERSLYLAGSMLSAGFVAEALGKDSVTAAQAAQNAALNNFLSEKQHQEKNAALQKAKTLEEREKILAHYAQLDAEQQQAAATCLSTGNCDASKLVPALRDELTTLGAVDCLQKGICSVQTIYSALQLAESNVHAVWMNDTYLNWQESCVPPRLCTYEAYEQAQLTNYSNYYYGTTGSDVNIRDGSGNAVVDRASSVSDLKNLLAMQNVQSASDYWTQSQELPLVVNGNAYSFGSTANAPETINWSLLSTGTQAGGTIDNSLLILGTTATEWNVPLAAVTTLALVASMEAQKWVNSHSWLYGTGEDSSSLTLPGYPSDPVPSPEPLVTPAQPSEGLVLTTPITEPNWRDNVLVNTPPNVTLPTTETYPAPSEEEQGATIITMSGSNQSGTESGAASNYIYNAQAIRTELEILYGHSNVTSTTVPPIDGRNVYLAGQRHPVTGIVFDTRGFPIFDDVAVFDTRLDSSQFSAASYEQQMQMASRDLWLSIQRGEVSASQFTPDQLSQIQSGSARIDGYTWHHHQDSGRMQLVPRDIHRTTGHIGGEGMSGGR
jgi:hypothetical protein